MMDLKDFIKASLIDIVSAVKETQETVKEYATISPLVTDGNKWHAVRMKDGIANVSKIDFDVAVTTESKDNAQNGIEAGIKVAGVFNMGLGSKGSASETAQNISRIRFSIPVILPCSASLDEVVNHDGKSIPRRELKNKKAR